MQNLEVSRISPFPPFLMPFFWDNTNLLRHSTSSRPSVQNLDVFHNLLFPPPPSRFVWRIGAGKTYYLFSYRISLGLSLMEFRWGIVYDCVPLTPPPRPPFPSCGSDGRETGWRTGHVIRRRLSFASFWFFDSLEGCPTARWSPRVRGRSL